MGLRIEEVLKQNEADKTKMKEVVMYESYELEDEYVILDPDDFQELPKEFKEKYFSSSHTDEYGFVTAIFSVSGAKLLNEVVDEIAKKWAQRMKNS